MKIISHRGYWQKAEEKNTEIAFRRSFDLEFGTETDLRDYQGQLLIAHDMTTGGEMTLDSFLAILGERSLPLTFDIKANGLARKFLEIIQKRGLTEFFVFDMSVPDLFEYIKAGIPSFTRMSEHEREPAFYDRAIGVWLDMFHSLWYDLSVIERILGDGKKVGIVSPELVGGQREELWNKLRNHKILGHEDILLCTDFPEEARAFLGV